MMFLKNRAERLKNNVRFLFMTGFVILVFLFFISVFAGTKALGFSEGIKVFGKLLRGQEVPAGVKVILLKLRLPRACAALFCGAGLSVAGLLLQVSLNNALASPGIMGVNAGAGFFVLLSGVLVPFSGFARCGGAFIGATIAILVVYLISERAGVSKTTLILSGVAVSSMMTAGIDVVITLHPEIIADKVSFNLGGFGNLDLSSLKIASLVIITGLLVSVFLSGGFDLFQLGDEVAFGLGLNVKNYRLAAILISGIMAGACVSVCGLLGFVGLIIPNVIRLCKPENTKVNIALCGIFGGAFLLLCDFLARTLFFPYELPVGLFLSLIGGPFFIWMIISRKRRVNL